MALERIREDQPEQEEQKSFEDIENMRSEVRRERNQNHGQLGVLMREHQNERDVAMVNIRELEEQRDLVIAI